MSLIDRLGRLFITNSNVENRNTKQFIMRKAKFLLIIALLATTTSASEKVIVSQWLTTGPLTLSLPAFHETADVSGKKFQDTEFLTFEQLDLNDYFPLENESVKWFGGNNANWERAHSNHRGFVEVVDSGAYLENYQVSYLAAYIKADRWLKSSLEIKSPQMLSVYLNGEHLGTKATVEKEENQIGKFSKNVELTKGTHLLLIKTVFSPEKNDSIADWRLSASFEIDEPFDFMAITTSLTPYNIKNINHILDGIKVSGTSLSPDGKYYIANYSRSLPPTNRSESWSEIKSVSGNNTVHSYRNASISGLTWLPKSNRVSYISRRDGKATLFLYDVENQKIEVLMEGIENVGSYRWSPDETYIAFYIREESKDDNSNATHLIGMRDRIPGFRNRSFLYKFDMESRVKTRLTFGNLTSSLLDISADGKKLLISHTRHEYDKEPYSTQDLYILDITDLSIDTLYYGKQWSVSASFSPDGQKLLATGGPGAFDGIGINIPEGLIPNNYDMQMYIINLEDKSVTPITKDFAPSINSAHWSRTDNNIYFTATDKDRRNLFSYDTRRGRINLIETGADMVDRFRLSSMSNMAVYYGNKTNEPHKTYLINLRNGRYSVLEDTDSHNYRNVRFGEVCDWDFQTEQGLDITGRVYLPHDFDENAKYPLIVYYYAGTSPVTRSFGGRYPFNLWAANDYIVYVLQPSGSIGFGQEFSAAHVNNWGATVADEIIEGTKKFLDAHPFADREKVGCAGASYGGFMTMLLITRTDIFTTAISHAGISSISSYWGEGFWGYGYSAVASAGSFPWNNKELYVGQSPLFHADKINTPLLLLTGDKDTNVPPGESFQMYTALTLLGKPVELVLIKGEDHHILTYNRRIEWHNTIMAWWDMMLKNQPEYWNKLYPEKNY